MKRCLILLGLLIGLLGLGVPIQAQEEEFVFGVILVGPANDHGWSQSHVEGGQYVVENVPGTRMLVFESLNPADAPETTLLDVVSEMVAQGAQLIFTTSDAFEEDTNVVARANPDVVFINLTGSNVLKEGVPSNVGNANGMIEYAMEIAGCAAGLTTQTGKIGYLGALTNAETRRLANSTFLAAQHCYNWQTTRTVEMEFTVTWIGFWFNIPGVTLDPTEVVNNFFDNGVDVVISGIDTTEAIEVAQNRWENGEVVFGVAHANRNSCDVAPLVCLGSPYHNWNDIYRDYVVAVMDGTWVQSWEWIPPDWSDINNPDTSSVGFTFGLGLMSHVEEVLDIFIGDMTEFSQDPVNDECLFLWKGPLNLQDGTSLADEGACVDPMAIWNMPQLLEGMVGASQSS